MSTKHKYYSLLNLIGYGLAKFDLDFVRSFSMETKISFYEYIVQQGIADTIGTVKNRQDLFDPFFKNKRKGWWQKGDAYIHRKLLIDSLFGDLNVESYSSVVKLHLRDDSPGSILHKKTPPIIVSKYKQLQETGKEAELFFMSNYLTIPSFNNGNLEDARTLGDGYDFQVDVNGHYFLAEVKGIHTNRGSIRLTKNEFIKANELKTDYVLVVVYNLSHIPKMHVVLNPIEHLNFSHQIVNQEQHHYHTKSILWNKEFQED